MFTKKRIFLVFLLVATLVASLVVFTACGKNNEEPEDTTVYAVDAASVSYDGTTVTWSAAKNAATYEVTVNGKKLTTSTTTLVAKIGDETSATIEIVSVGSDGTKSETAATVTLGRLDTVESIEFDEAGAMTWESVDGASGYEVEINGKVTEVTVNAGFADFALGEANRIRVRAKTDNKTAFATWSESVTKTYLGAPSGVSYDGQHISWTGSSLAQSYTVYINGAESGTTKDAYLQFNADNKSFEVEVRANGNSESIYTSPKSEKVSYFYLAQISEFSLADGVLSWTPVEQATSYELIVEGKTAEVVTEPKYTKLSTGTQHTVKVRAIAPAGAVSYYSVWSEEQHIHFLNSPVLHWNANLKLDGEELPALYWDSQSGEISGYTVRVISPNGETQDYTFGETQKEFRFAFKDTGTYKVSVKTNAKQNTNTADSPFSETFTVIRLAAPRAASQNHIVSNPESLDDGFTVNYQSVSGATKYRLYKNGVIAAGYETAGTSMKVGSVIDKDTVDQRTIQYLIQSVGSTKSLNNGTITADTIITLDSLTEASLEFEITVLARPTGINFAGGMVRWDDNANAHGYTVIIGKANHANNNEYSLRIAEAGNYKVSVNACGNGAAILSSPYTEEYNVVKLEAPTNIRINTRSQNYVILYDKVANATSYEFAFGNDMKPVKEAELGNINDRIHENTLTVNVRAVRDEYEASNKTYYLTSEWSQSKQFTKLRAVDNVRFTNSQLVWNNTNVNTTPRYTVNMDGYDLENILTSTSLNLGEMNLKPGDHVFKIRCLGDGETTIDSDLSGEFTVKKLEMPTVTRTKTAYVWNAIAYAGSYAVYVDGTLVKTLTKNGGSTYEYVPTTLVAIKDYKIEVKAVGDDGESTIASDACVLTQKVEKLSTINPENFDLSYSEEIFNPTSGKLNVTLKTAVENAAGYRYTIGSTTSEATTEMTYSQVLKNHGRYDVSIVAVGGEFNVETGIFYLDSDPSSSKTFTVFGEVPANALRALNPAPNDVRLSWSTFESQYSGFLGFYGKIVYKDATEQKFETNSNVREVRLNEGKTVYDIDYVEIYVKGNGKTNVTSQVTRKYDFV